MKRDSLLIGLVIAVGLASTILFVWFQNTGLGAGDSGDVVTAAITHGVSHPPGYPLYTAIGFIVSKLPLFTPAWRVGLLSSIPHALVVGCIAWFVASRTKKVFPTLVTSLFLIGNYVFFLYSVTQEVFALYHLFLVVFVLSLISLVTNSRALAYFCLAFAGATAFTHHQLLFFVFPVAMWVMAKQKNRITKRTILYTILGLLLGLLPLLYLPWAGGSGSSINWDHPTTPQSIIHLLSRSDYGSFLSSGKYGESPKERLLSTLAYFQFFFVDFGLPGFVFLGYGIWWLFVHRKKDAQILLASSLLLGPIFAFYASFPLLNRFTIGTYERFLMGSYILISPFLGIGAWRIREYLARVIGKYVPFNPAYSSYIISFVILCIPAFTFITTVYRIAPLKNDKTFEEVGVDILASLPKDSIVLLRGDTSLFSAQYVRYANNFRPDLFVLHDTRMAASDYSKTIHEAFPGLSVPLASGSAFPLEFIKANRKHPVFSNTKGVAPPEFGWVPIGLLYKLTPLSDISSLDSIIGTSTAVFATYHNPLLGALATYPHLLLSDVLNVYATAYGEFGKLLLAVGRSEEAKKQLQTAVLFAADSSVGNYPLYLSLSLALSGQCDSALRAITTSRSLTFGNNPESTYYEALVYKECFKDATKAAELIKTYEKDQHGGDDWLEKWR